MNNKTLLIAGISAMTIGVIGISGFTSAANTNTGVTSNQTRSISRGMKGGNFGPGRGQGFGGEHGERGMFGGENTAIKAAIDTNDYNAFVTARNANTNKPSDATIPTQDQFTKMVEQSKKQTTIDTALSANDYDAYIKATTLSKEEFAQRVSEYKTRTALQSAIKSNDYNAFKTAWESDTNKPSDTTIPTQDEFTKMVERFTSKSTEKSNQ